MVSKFIIRSLLVFFLGLLLCPVGLGQTVWVRDYFDYAKKQLRSEYQANALNKAQINGLYVSYYQDGTVQCKGRYVNNLQSNKWSYFFENGNKKSTGEYILGEKTGQWEYFFENGNLAQIGRLVANKKQGYWKYFYESGSIKIEGEFILDKCNGLWNYYNEDGTLKATCTFLKGKGLYTEKYANGKVKMQGLVKDGGSDSAWIYFYENGNKKAEGYEKNSIKLGHWQFYNPDGSLASEGDFNANLENGPWVYYHANGQVNSKGLMINGKKEGIWQLYFDSGKFMGEAKFEKGVGKYSEYYPDGKLRLTGFIEGSKYIGSWSYHYQDGGLEGECFYINGEGDYIGYYPDGSKKMSGRLKNGKKIGIWKLYDIEGNLSGLYKSYFDNDDNQIYVDSTETNPAQIATASPTKKSQRLKLITPIRNMHLFRPRVNEKQSIILSINPLAPLFSSLPVSLEYYFDKRVGYEAGVALYRKPFWGDHASYLTQLYGAPVAQGFYTFIRQKLYFGRKRPDTYYFGPELRYSRIDFSESVLLPAGDSSHLKSVSSATETKFELSLLMGKRFFLATSRYRFCLDVFTGFGVGYRSTHYTANSSKIADIPDNRLTVPVRLGFSAGLEF